MRSWVLQWKVHRVGKIPPLLYPRMEKVSQIVREHEGIARLGGDRAKMKEGVRLYWSSVGQRFTVEWGEIAQKGVENWKDIACAT